MKTYELFGGSERRLRSMSNAQLLLLAIFSDAQGLQQIDDELDRRACGIHGSSQPDEHRQMRVSLAA